jgi:tetratricopeptide (TPR) repeat protein
MLMSDKTNLSTSYRYLLYLLIATGLFVYSNNLSGPFIFDDNDAIVNNRHIRRLWPIWEAMITPGQTAVANRPVVSVTLAINYAIGRLNVGSYHIFNIVVHILSALVLFGVVRRTLLSRKLRERFGRHSGGIALACAMIWMVHPLQTECVNYIVQRTESIMGLFYLLTFYCMIRAIDSKHRYYWYAASIVCCALGMGSKEVMVTAPIMVLLYDRVFISGTIKKAFRERRFLYIGLAGTWCILVLLVYLGPESESAGFTKIISTWNYAQNQCLMITNYLRLVFWPDPLVIDYGFPWQLKPSQTAPYALLVLTLLAVTVVGFFRWPKSSYPALWFFVILGPTSSFFTISTEVGAERRMYLPLAGIIVIVVIIVERLLTYFQARYKGLLNLAVGRLQYLPAVLLLTIVVAVLGWMARQRNKDYLTALSIWRLAVEAMPHNIRAHNNYAMALVEEGKISEGINHYHKALERGPYFEAHFNLANALSIQGKTDLAISHYNKALELRPNSAIVHNNLGNIYKVQGELDRAIEHYQKAVDSNPDYAVIYNNFANVLRVKGRYGYAIQNYKKALQLKPDWIGVMGDLSWLLATSPDADVRDPATALRLAQKANKLTNYSHPEVLFTLATAYAAEGKFSDAVEIAEKAIDLAEAANRKELAGLIRKYLQLYKAGQPYYLEARKTEEIQSQGE